LLFLRTREIAPLFLSLLPARFPAEILSCAKDRFGRGAPTLTAAQTYALL